MRFVASVMTDESDPIASPHSPEFIAMQTALRDPWSQSVYQCVDRWLESYSLREKIGDDAYNMIVTNFKGYIAATSAWLVQKQDECACMQMMNDAMMKRLNIGEQS